jgi:hypothetical protein
MLNCPSIDNNAGTRGGSGVVVYGRDHLGKLRMQYIA